MSVVFQRRRLVPAEVELAPGRGCARSVSEGGGLDVLLLPGELDAALMTMSRSVAFKSYRTACTRKPCVAWLPLVWNTAPFFEYLTTPFSTAMRKVSPVVNDVSTL